MAQSIKEFKAEKQAAISMAQSVEFLLKNKHFKKVFSENFFKEEPIRCAVMKAQPSMKEPYSQSVLDKRINSVGDVQMYLQTLTILGSMATNELAEFEALPEPEEGEEYEYDNEE